MRWRGTPTAATVVLLRQRPHPALEFAVERSAIDRPTLRVAVHSAGTPGRPCGRCMRIAESERRGDASMTRDDVPDGATNRRRINGAEVAEHPQNIRRRDAMAARWVEVAAVPRTVHTDARERGRRLRRRGSARGWIVDRAAEHPTASPPSDATPVRTHRPTRARRRRASARRVTADPYMRATPGKSVRSDRRTARGTTSRRRSPTRRHAATRDQTVMVDARTRRVGRASCPPGCAAECGTES